MNPYMILLTTLDNKNILVNLRYVRNICTRIGGGSEIEWIDGRENIQVIDSINVIKSKLLNCNTTAGF